MTVKDLCKQYEKHSDWIVTISKDATILTGFFPEWGDICGFEDCEVVSYDVMDHWLDIEIAEV